MRERQAAYISGQLVNVKDAGIAAISFIKSGNGGDFLIESGADIPHPSKEGYSRSIP